MTPQQQAQYIQQQRVAGVPDTAILANLKQQTQPQEALQRSGAGELLPAAFSVGGGILGAMGGSLAGPVGTVVGGVGGATAGGALGESIQQRIETGFGLRDKINVGQIAAQGAISGGTQLIAGGVLKVLGFTAQVAKPTLVKFLSKLSGYSDDVLQYTLQKTPGAIKGISQGEVALKDVVVATAQGLDDLAKTTLTESQKKVTEFSSKAIISGQGAKSELLKQTKNFYTKTIASLRSKYKIGVDKYGDLLFDRPSDMSNIVSGGDRSAIQTALHAIRTINQNPTIKNIDSVLERLIVLRSKTPVGSPTGPETRAIIGDMSENVVQFVRSVPPSFGKGWAQYGLYLDDILAKRVMISDAKELFGRTKHLSPKEISQITKRMLQLFNTGNLAPREFAEEVGEKVGTEIVETSAGTLMSTGGMTSVRAPELTTPGIARQIVQYVPAKVVKTYVTTGKIIPEFSGFIKKAAQIAGVSVKTLMQDIVNLQFNKTSQ